MRIWSVQPQEVYNQLLREGKFICDPSRSELVTDYGFGKPYDWMSMQMKKRIGEPPEGVIYPIWAWHTLDWQHKKPDLRRSEFRFFEGDQLCIELEIPDQDVLLSDEEAWHFVLNNWYYGDASNEEESKREDAWFDSLSIEEQAAVKAKSWEKIFDVAPLDNGWSRRGCFIQATFWQLEPENVMAVRKVKRRYKASQVDCEVTGQ